MKILKSPYIGQRISIMLSVILLIITTAYVLVDNVRFENFLYDLSQHDLENAWTNYLIGKVLLLLVLTGIGALFWPYTYKKLWDWIINTKKDDSEKNTESVFLSILQGKKPLGFTFWCVYFIPNFILTTILNSDQSNEIPLAVVILFVAYYTWSSIAAWRAAQRAQCSFTHIAKGIIGISWLVNAAFLLIVFTISLAQYV